MISFTCAAVGAAYPDDGYKMVFAAAGITTAMFAALTLYALTTKTDYTYCGGFLWAFFFTFAFFGIFCWIWPSYWSILLYCSIGIVLISFYFIYDIQIICGKGYWKLDMDDYIIGALILYVDFIYLFLRIL